MKKKSKKPLIILAVIIILIGGGIISLKKQMENAAATLAMPASIQVTAGDIVSTVSGGGYIAIDESVDIKLPSELVIDEYLFEVGDMVEEGDVIANIDPASITSAIVSAQSELENINNTLKDTSDMTSYEIEEYNTRKDFLNAKIEILTAYYLNPVIVATQSGVISAVGNGTSDQTAGVNIEDYADLLIKNDPEPASSGEETIESSTESSEETAATSESTTAPTETTPSETSATTEPSQTAAPTTPAPAFDAVTDLSDLTITAPVAGQAPQSSIAETDKYTGIITWIPAAAVFDPGTAYTAMVTLTPKDGYGFDPLNLPELSVAGATVIPMSSTDGNYVAMLAFAPTEGEAPAASDAAAAFQLPDDFDINQFISNYTGGSSLSLPTSDYAALYNAATASQYSALAAAYSSGSLNVGSGRPSSNSAENLVVTIASTETAILSIQIDEMDILKIHEGQDATLSLVAIPGEEFTGEIIHVSNISNGSSGNTKYDVDILIQMDDSMRFGMSADATIVVSEVTGVPTIPMEALQQTGSQTFVFTSVAEDGTLTGEVPVETGVSDGLTVEIVSGINIGDTIYYERNDENPLAAFM